LKSSGSACSAIGNLPVNLDGAKPLGGCSAAPVLLVAAFFVKINDIQLCAINFHDCEMIPDGSMGNNIQFVPAATRMTKTNCRKPLPAKQTKGRMTIAIRPSTVNIRC